jgi:two-component system, chemotaxis family, chemotaxis protein CheY
MPWAQDSESGELVVTALVSKSDLAARERSTSALLQRQERRSSVGRDGLASPNMNLRDLVILIADPSSYMSMLIQRMLRGFGSNKVLEARNSLGVFHALTAQRIDLLLCDAQLPLHGGLQLTHAIRSKKDNEHRTIPILIMTSDSRASTIKQARDAGANMVIAKPLSAASLYDRLTWIAFNPRKFVDTATYFGPDRRFKIEGYPDGVGRRKGDKVTEVAKESGPALAQDDIDSLFTAAQSGRD